ncbi:hypothetical protein IV203_009982 [Nitzschia inconspicua]|uniref:Exportin-1/Importin-beta-like domain-containing protein n=1 Tax=Nitzschia inconspicua TaxID=303405 RepID=A0A9K3PK24_9STRA|nr:hypothetical protein IV203_009982 [Nitzschia inconspicua]
MEEQVAQAARCIVQASVDPTMRRQASQFLEEWTQTPDAWDVYGKWLSSYRHLRLQQGSDTANNDSDSLSMQILCLTMLQSKIRKELRKSQPVSTWHPSVAAVRAELWEYLQQLRVDSPEDRPLISPCCICNAAMIVRSSDGMMAEFMNQLMMTTNSSSSNNNNHHHHQGNALSLPRETALRVLAGIPVEMETCQELANTEVTAELSVHMEIVLDVVQKSLLLSQSTLLPACQVLQSWTETAHISLSQLNTPTFGGNQAVLPTLIHLLSIHGPTNYYDEITLQSAARALTNAILVVTDHCSSTRAAAAESFWVALSQQRFIVHPLHIATQQQWHDASHALASLLSTFVVEQVDDLVAQPADVGLQILLELQAHPCTSVALVPLEIWLTIQEIPTSDRHDDWKQPLYRKLVEVLLMRITYPQTFMSWDEELELDSSEFFELRRLVSDVLSSCYFLMRGEMIHTLIQKIQNATHWTTRESALYCLAQIAKDVCTRCKSHAPDGTMVAKDRDASRQELLQLLEQLMNMDTETLFNQSTVLLAAVINFLGTYSPAWNSIDCPPVAIVRLMEFLQFALKMLPLESAKAIRAICISCLAKLMPSIEDLHSKSNVDFSQTIVPAVLKSVRESMEAVLATTEEEAMTMVAEGATRLVTKVADVDVARQALTNDLIRPVLRHVNAALEAMPQNNSVEEWSTPSVQLATEALIRDLDVINTIARFCDAPHIPAMSGWFLQDFGHCLDSIHHKTQSSPIGSMILPKWISIHQQVIQNAPPLQDTSLHMLQSTIPLVVQALEHSRDLSTLKYISTAVEKFGGKTDQIDQSFQQLLERVATIVIDHPNVTDSTEFLQCFFDCLQRFLLYCPRALCYNSKFDAMVNFSVDAVTGIQDKEAIRAALVFLSQLFGWNSLRLPQQSFNVMQEVWHTGATLKDLLGRNGQRLIEACFKGLAGGSQMLWPAYSSCIFSIVQAFVMNPSYDQINPANVPSPFLNESLLHQWLARGIMSTLTSDTDLQMCNQIISILLTLSRQGPKSVPRAKMLLTDFAKIRRGEVKLDALISFTLP